MASPRLVGKCTEKHPEEWESQRFLAIIVTWFLSTGGLPHQCAHWFAMTGYFEAKPFKHQFIWLLCWEGNGSANAGDFVALVGNGFPEDFVRHILRQRHDSGSGLMADLGGGYAVNGLQRFLGVHLAVTAHHTFYF